jgi:hypothetical protein
MKLNKSNIATNKESKDGTWEYTHFPNSTHVKFEYWKENDETPSVTINVTVKEFNDLIDFGKRIAKPIKIKRK